MLSSFYPLWPYIAGLVVLLLALVLLRGLSNGRFEVKLTDAVIVALPVLLWLVGTGQVRKLIVSTEGLADGAAIRARLAPVHELAHVTVETRAA